MKEVKYQDVSSRIHHKAVTGNKRVPVNATLELTYRCNNRCVHCYCNLPTGDKIARESELSLEEIEKIFDELKEMGCLWLLITGGEPLLRDDFSQVYLAAKSRGFLVTVFTNGILVDDEVA
ncbi:MAG: radical SAM protein, partial [Thermodesulfovibrionales bacterium]